MPRAARYLPEAIFDRGKKTEVESAILLYIARPDPIYIINILTYTNVVNDQVFSADGSVVKTSVCEVMLVGSNFGHCNF